MELRWTKRSTDIAEAEKKGKKEKGNDEGERGVREGGKREDEDE